MLDAPHVVLAELRRVGVAVEGRHDGAGLQGMLQAQHVAKLVGRHLQKVHPFAGPRSKVSSAGGHRRSERSKAGTHLRRCPLSSTRRSQSGRLPAGASWGRRREPGCLRDRRRVSCRRASTCPGGAKAKLAG